MDIPETPIGRPRQSRIGRTHQPHRRPERPDRAASWYRPEHGSSARPWIAAALLLLVAETLGGLGAIVLICVAAWAVTLELPGSTAGGRGGSGGGGLRRVDPGPSPRTTA